MYETTINEIIRRTNLSSKTAQVQLETEESGRVVASLQGEVSGYRKLLEYLAAEFHVTQIRIEAAGSEPASLPDLDDDMIFMMENEIHALKTSDLWGQVLGRIEKNADQLKNHLLFQAEKSRDLDLSQGQYRATVSFEKHFESVKNEADHRRKEQAEKRKNPELGFQ